MGDNSAVTICVVLGLIVMALPVLIVVAAVNALGGGSKTNPPATEGGEVPLSQSLRARLQEATHRPDILAAARDYVWHARQEGLSDEAIETTLLAAGWTSGEAQTALSSRRPTESLAPGG